MKDKKFLSVLLVAALFLMSFGSVAFAQEQTELTVTWWGSDNRHNRTIEVIEMFEAEYPHIDVTYEFSSWGDYWTRVNTQASGGSVACVMQHDYNLLTEWATRGLLMPLDELVETGAIDLSEVADTVLDGGRVVLSADGETTNQLFGISLGSNSQVYIIDADAFAEAGLELPAWDWTWDDFEEMAYQMHENTGKWMIAYGPWDDNSTGSYILSSGELPFTVDGSALGWENSAPLVEYFSRLKRLMDAGVIPSMDMQPDVEAASPSHEQSPIIRGGEAIRYQWSNQVVSLVNAAGEDRNFVLHPLPRAAGGRSANYLKPSMFFSVTEGCETVEEAALFIDYFTNNLEANEVLFAERGVPIAPDVQEHLSTIADETNIAIFDFIAQITQDASPIPPPPPAGYIDIQSNVFVPVFVEPVLFGMISPEEGVEAYRIEAQAILDANQ